MAPGSDSCQGPEHFRRGEHRGRGETPHWQPFGRLHMRHSFEAVDYEDGTARPDEREAAPWGVIAAAA
jgi:hypothetical protein